MNRSRFTQNKPIYCSILALTIMPTGPPCFRYRQASPIRFQIVIFTQKTSSIEFHSRFKLE